MNASLNSAPVGIGSGRTATVHAFVDPVTQQAGVTITVHLNGHDVQLAVDWNELFNLSGPFL
ncbi:hypothetical protein [Roseateles depolymerans]|uniref:Uncharacterized protein n=1 Tax=Roseateles depolymerans TaxID=76731 RepID=A0A0U3E3E5_9BURK|nr:hypothetical protein [Roseateles depolymerans]ALV07717.1 hypothetical protein RD2015_3259 [Roseateles depolymerans]REG22059.1 hypothetical protein DES44_1201 [Roseateles depolymerans]